MHRSALVCSLLASGCMVGGGPIVGCKLGGGCFGGVEAGTGVAIAQVWAGYHSDPHAGYLRLDAAVDYKDSPGARLGGGVVFGQDDAAGMFVLGGHRGYVLREYQRCDAYEPVVNVGVDLRYSAGAWRVVLAPRIEAQSDLCIH